MTGRPRRIGVFGGSFDPPHIAHLICARAAAEELGLERVLVVPAAVQPHKPEGAGAPGASRLRMVAAAVADDPLFEICAVEIERGGVSYTAETLAELAGRYPAPEFGLVLIVGADSLADIRRWKDPPQIFRLAEVAAMTRPGALVESLPSEWERRIIRVATPLLDVSSSDIRRRAAEGLSLSYLVPPAVEEIIRAERLYLERSGATTNGGES